MKTKYLVWGTVVFSVITLALVIFGVLTHKEPGLLHVCWANNQAKFVEQEDLERAPCDSPEELVWPASQLPIPVAAFAYDGTPTRDDIEMVKDAIEAINGKLDYKHLRYTSEEAPISVTFRSPYETGTGTSLKDRVPGSCKISRVPDGNGSHTLRGDVVLRQLPSSHTIYRVVLHELGHCGLGLDHDPYEGSIMYPTTVSVETGPLLQGFSDWDVDLLRSTYRGKSD